MKREYEGDPDGELNGDLKVVLAAFLKISFMDNWSGILTGGSQLGSPRGSSGGKNIALPLETK